MKGLFNSNLLDVAASPDIPRPGLNLKDLSQHLILRRSEKIRGLITSKMLAEVMLQVAS